MLTDLPEELLVLICTYLDVGSLRSIILSCRQLARVAQDTSIWRHLLTATYQQPLRAKYLHDNGYVRRRVKKAYIDVKDGWYDFYNSQLSVGDNMGTVAEIIFLDPTTIVTAGTNGKICGWDSTAARLLRSFYGHYYEVTCLARVSPSLFLSGGMDCSVRLFHRHSSKAVHIWKHKDWVRQVTSRGTVAASVGRDGLLGVWDMQSGGEHVQLSLPSRVPLWSLALAGGEKSLADTVTTGDLEGTLRVWDVRGGCSAFSAQPHRDIVSKVWFSADSNLIYSTSYDGSVAVYDVRGGRVGAHHPSVHRDAITDVALLRNKGRFFTAGANGYLALHRGLEESDGGSRDGSGKERGEPGSVITVFEPKQEPVGENSVTSLLSRHDTRIRVNEVAGVVVSTSAAGFQLWNLTTGNPRQTVAVATDNGLDGAASLAMMGDSLAVGFHGGATVYNCLPVYDESDEESQEDEHGAEVD